MTPRAPLAAAIAVGLLLAGCSSDPDPVASPTPTASASSSASASASPSPTSTLSADKQQAIDEAAAVVLAYEQMFFDLQADPDPRLNDINNVVADPQLDHRPAQPPGGGALGG